MLPFSEMVFDDDFQLAEEPLVSGADLFDQLNNFIFLYHFFTLPIELLFACVKGIIYHYGCKEFLLQH